MILHQFLRKAINFIERDEITMVGFNNTDWLELTECKILLLKFGMIHLYSLIKNTLNSA
jgi:hypothetical protein